MRRQKTLSRERRLVSLCLRVLRIVVRGYHFEATQAYKNLLSFEDDSIVNCHFMAIVPEFTHIVWYFLDCVFEPVKMTWLRPQRVDNLETGSFMSDLTLLG